MREETAMSLKWIANRLKIITGILCGISAGFAASKGFWLPNLAKAYGESIPIVCVCILYWSCVVALPLSACVRLFRSVFSTEVRHLLKSHPLSHAMWFGASVGIIIGVVTTPGFFSGRGLTS